MTESKIFDSLSVILRFCGYLSVSDHFLSASKIEKTLWHLKWIKAIYWNLFCHLFLKDKACQNVYILSVDQVTPQ